MHCDLTNLADLKETEFSVFLANYSVLGSILIRKGRGF
jgi:hypothetical protein